MTPRQRAMRAAIAAVHRAAAAAGAVRGPRILAALSEGLRPVKRVAGEFGELEFWCPGETALWRAETLAEKEPDTLEWIAGFQPGDVFWDVGANVGVYSLVAARARGATVLAFEPAAPNYAVLCRNIELNGLDGAVAAYCLAFAGGTALGRLNMATTASGAALHGFGGADSAAAFRQGMVGFTLDEFAERFDPPRPNHLKIDVDGIEDLIVAGGPKLLSDPRLRTLMVELDTADRVYLDRVMSMLADAGLSLRATASAPQDSGGRFASYFNHHFVRA